VDCKQLYIAVKNRKHKETVLPLSLALKIYAGRCIMLSVITNIYNQKTKGPTLMELLTATGKLKKFFWPLEMFDVCTTGDMAHINTILKFLPHASTWVHRYSSLLQWSVTLGQRGQVAMVGCTQYVPQLSCDVADLKSRIIAAVKNIDAPMLMRVWQELEYRINVCRVTHGAHIEHL
jgi:hypothetical protein